jgi:hypothetical protein
MKYEILYGNPGFSLTVSKICLCEEILKSTKEITPVLQHAICFPCMEFSVNLICSVVIYYTGTSLKEEIFFCSLYSA